MEFMMKVSTSPGVYNNKSPECKNQGGFLKKFFSQEPVSVHSKNRVSGRH
jgi:hypothetical protein